MPAAPPGLPRHDAGRLDGRLPLRAVAPTLAAIAELAGEAALRRGLRRHALARSPSGASALAVLAGQTLLAPLVALLRALAPLLWGPRAVFATVVTLLRAIPALLPQLAPLLRRPRAFLATVLTLLRALLALVSELATLLRAALAQLILFLFLP
jgi:hypothetical protein